MTTTPTHPFRVLRDTIAGPRRLSRLGRADDEATPSAVDEASDAYPFEVRPLAPTIGAEISDVDLADVDDILQLELHRALLEWKVLFFRDQNLTNRQQRDFAARWGELERHPFLPSSEPDVVRFEKGPEVSGVENIWHSDVTWKAETPLGAVLRCIDAPAIGGDTLWADMYSAYDFLPAEVRNRIDGLRAVHDFTASFGQAMTASELAAAKAKFPAVEHPVVRTHPETGRKLLFVNEPFTTRIVGLDEDDSDALLRYLCSQARTPEYQCRFHWTPGSIAFWDNRCTQHYAISDYWPRRRVMERVSILGDRPY